MKSLFKNKNYLSSKKEIKLSIEAMTQCAAGCAGCFLTPELRAKSNLWDLQKLKQVGKFAQQFVQENSVLYNNIDDLILNFGQGDYLILNESEIDNMLEEVCSWFPNKSSLYFTSSAVTKHKIFKRSLDLFHMKSLEKNLPLSIALVLDSSKLDSQFFPIYEQNINYAKNKMGSLDLHLNLGMDVIENIFPENIDNFLVKNKIEFITINFVPSHHSKLTKENWYKINDWLVKWLNIWNPEKYEINFVKTIRHHFGAFADDNDLIEQLESSNSVVKREVVIDYDGNAYTQQEGIGDIPLTNRNGFNHFMNIFEYNFSQDSILNKIDHHQNIINKKLIKSFNRDKSCNSCEYAKVCTQLGVLAMKNVLSFDSKKINCDFNLPTLFDKILTKKENENLKIIGDNFDKIRPQKGLVNNNLLMDKTHYDDSLVSLEILKNKN